MSQPTDRMSAVKRSGRAMPVTTNTRELDGTTTESRSPPTRRGAQVDRGAQPPLGQAAGEIAIGTDEHGHAGERARQHQRLVAGLVEIRDYAGAVGDNGDAVAGDAAAVAARQHRRTLALLDQQTCD